jgi:hypothetical protein
MAADTRYRSDLPAEAAVAATAGWHNRVSWGAIFAGFFCAVAIQAVLTMIGLAWGFGSIEPTEQARPFQGLLMGGGIYWTVTSIVSLFIGGWIAARLAAFPFTVASALHGISVWALSTIFILFLVGSMVNMAARATAATAQAAAQTVTAAGGTVADIAGRAFGAVDQQLMQQIQQAAQQRDLTAQDIRQELQTMYNEVITPREQRRAGEVIEETAREILRTPGDFSTDISTGLDRLFGGEEAVLNEQDRQELVSAIAERFDISNREAERIVNRWQTRWEEATQRLGNAVERAQEAATEAADQVTDAAANTSISLAIAFLLGLLAAAAGGGVGRIGLGSRHHY